MTKLRAAIYSRVSTADQDTAMQIAELEAYAARKGWEVVKQYTDEGISGAKGRDKRPGLDAALKGAARRSYDVLLVWSIDRLGRSLAGLIDTLETLHNHERDLYMHQQSVDTSSSMGRLVFQMVGAFAEFERSIIGERVRSGIARAKAKGTRLGRPTLKEADRAEIRALLGTGLSVKAVAKQLKRGNSIVNAVKKEMEA